MIHLILLTTDLLGLNISIDATYSVKTHIMKLKFISTNKFLRGNIPLIESTFNLRY